MQNALQLPPADEVLLAVGEEPSNRVLLAGCDPTTSFLGRYLQGAGIDRIIAPFTIRVLPAVALCERARD